MLCAGTGILISTEVVRTALGSSALEPGNDFKLTAWLGGQEDQHKVVVYQGGHSH
jgi:lysophospholipid hydrolase